MGYVEGFKWDVFLSYASVDNQKIEPHAGWVDRFYQHLNASLDQSIGRSGAASIFFDKREVRTGVNLDASLERAVRESAIFLHLTSKGSLFPDCYCSIERKLFVDRARDDPIGLIVGDYNRIFNVLLDNVPDDEWPSEFRNVRACFDFYESGAKPYQAQRVLPDDRIFLRSVGELARSLNRALDECRNVLTVHPQETPNSPTNIFVASSTRRLAIERERLVKELKRLGHDVLTEPPPPEDEIGHDRRLEETLKEAALSVHLLDDEDGLLSNSKSSPSSQWKTIEGRGVRSVLWIPKHVDLEARERTPELDFLREIERQPRTEENRFRVCRTLSVSDLVKEVEARLAEISSDQAGRPQSQVLVDTYMTDQIVAHQLAAKLCAHEVQPYLTCTRDRPSETIREFDEKLRLVNMVVIVFGSVQPKRIEERVKFACKRIAEQGDFDKRVVLLLARPEKPDDCIKLPPIFAIPRIDSSRDSEISEAHVQAVLRLLKGA